MRVSAPSTGVAHVQPDPHRYGPDPRVDPGPRGLRRRRLERHCGAAGLDRTSPESAPPSTCTRTPSPRSRSTGSSRHSSRPRSARASQFQQSYGASGDQSRKVAAGAEADFVNFSVEPDVSRLVDAGLVDADWNAGRARGHPVRVGRHHRRAQGQPQGHQGLGRPARARRRGRHAEPVLVGLRQVEPARAVRGQE